MIYKQRNLSVALESSDGFRQPDIWMVVTGQSWRCPGQLCHRLGGSGVNIAWAAAREGCGTHTHTHTLAKALPWAH